MNKEDKIKLLKDAQQVLKKYKNKRFTGTPIPPQEISKEEVKEIINSKIDMKKELNIK